MPENELDHEKLYHKLEKLIHWAARHYGSTKNIFLSQEDLVAEGWLVFSKLLQSHSHLSQESFERLFKTSLFNHIRTLFVKYKYNSHRGYNQEDNLTAEENYIDLSEIADSVGMEHIFDIYYKEYVTQVISILKNYPEAIKLFNQLIEPDDEVYVMVLNEAKRKKHLVEQGRRCEHFNTIRVKRHHIQKHLGYSYNKMSKCMKLITKAVQQVVQGCYLQTVLSTKKA